VRLAAVPKIAAIYSSPLERARETVARRWLIGAPALAVRVEPGLLESDLGAWTGLSLKRAAKRPEWAVVQRHASAFRFPGGESFVEMQHGWRARGTARRAASRRQRRRRLARRSDQDPGGARARHAARSLPRGS